MSSRVAITIPTMLAGLIGGSRKVSVDADDVAGAIDSLTTRHPELRVHILDDAGNLRPHVTVFHNDGQATDWSVPVGHGDTITVLQAVSGGRR